MNISLVTNESNLHFPQLDRDDDPMKKVRDLEAKVKKKNEEMSNVQICPLLTNLYYLPGNA